MTGCRSLRYDLAPMRSTRAAQLKRGSGGDDADLLLRSEELLDAMERYVAEHRGCDGASWRSGDFTAGAMLEFKRRHCDGRLTHWTIADLREFLLVWLPEFVLADDDVLRDVPECSATFFDFLAHADLLTGDRLQDLRTTCQRVGVEFLVACADVRRWSPAKSRLTRVLETARCEAAAHRPDRRF